MWMMKMHKDQEEWIVDSKDDFNGWEILHSEEWKPGIKRISMRRLMVTDRHPAFIIAYCKDEFLRGTQDVIG